MRSLLAEYLEKAGFPVPTASSAADARRQINAVDPDVLVPPTMWRHKNFEVSFCSIACEASNQVRPERVQSLLL
jgi:hypothetical protein